MSDASSASRDDAGPGEHPRSMNTVDTDDGTIVGVLLVGHGDTASHLLTAARRIVPSGLEQVEALDAWDGRTPAFDEQLCERIESKDRGRGVLILVDLMGSSPCSCALAQAAAHEVIVVAGLNIAMLLKLATVDRRSLDVQAIAEACADSGRRSVVVREAKVA